MNLDGKDAYKGKLFQNLLWDPVTKEVKNTIYNGDKIFCMTVDSTQKIIAAPCHCGKLQKWDMIIESNEAATLYAGPE